MHRPTTRHYSAVKRLLQYLHGTIEYGLFIKKLTSISSCFFDANWAENVNGRISQVTISFFWLPMLSRGAQRSRKQLPAPSPNSNIRRSHLPFQITWIYLSFMKLVSLLEHTSTIYYAKSMLPTYALIRFFTHEQSTSPLISTWCMTRFKMIVYVYLMSHPVIN